MHQDGVKDLYNLKISEKENVIFCFAAKSLIYKAGSEAHPFPFDLSSLHISTKHNEIVSTPSGIFCHASLTSASKYLSHKLNLSCLDLIDWKSRIIAVDKFSLHLHTWASKSLSNFEGTSQEMHQKGLWYSPLCRCFLDQEESDNTHILHCTNTSLSAIREDPIERFVSNGIKLDANQDAIQVLLQHMLDETSAPPPHLAQLLTFII